MKKLISVILVAAMVLSLTGCNLIKLKKKDNDAYNYDDVEREYNRTRNGTSSSSSTVPRRKDKDTDGSDVDPDTWETSDELIETEEPDTDETTDTDEVSETDETPETTEPEQTRETAAPTSRGNSSVKLSDYVRDARSRYSIPETDGEYHVPEVVFKTSYAAEMKQEIDGCFAVYADLIAEYGYSHYYSTHYIAFISPGGVLSIVFVEIGEWGDDIYHVWNFDINTGNKVENSKIAQLAGVKSIRQAAMDAVQKNLNQSGMIVVKDYQLVSSDYDYMKDTVANSFSKENLNDNMPVGLTNEGKMFFISPIASFAGADYYYTMYDIDGNGFYNDPAWVR